MRRAVAARRKLGRMVSKRSRLAAADRVWPEVMTTSLVILYSGVSRSTLARARRAGRLEALGRVGGVGQITYQRAAVDAWLRGDGGEARVIPLRARLMGKEGL